jgi:hypothetical protein
VARKDDLTSVAASGSTPLSYQWFKDGVALVGANGATVSIPTSAADAGKIIAVAVRVSNGAGQVTSHAASLSTANGADFNLRA